MFDFLKQQPIPDNFDYKRKKKEIGQKAEIAKNLQGFRWGGQLQMLDGGYTAGGLTNPLSTIATIAANVAGAKLLANSQKEQDALDEAGDKLYRQGIQALKDIRENPTEAEKNAAKDVQDLSYFANDPLLPYDIKDKTPAPVAQTSPVDAPATVEAKPLGRTLPKSATGSGRGKQGGPTAAQAIAGAAEKIDARNRQSPMQVFPDGVGKAIRSPWVAGRTTAGEPIYDNMGREDIGVSPLTPQQIEAQMVNNFGAGAGRGVQGGPNATERAEYARQVSNGSGRGEQGGPTADVADAGAYKNLSSVGGGRGVQGGPTAAQAIAGAAEKIDAQNLQSPLKVYPTGMGIGRIGASQMTPQQMEGNIVNKVGAPYIPPESVLPAATAARQADSAGGGRGVQGGQSFADVEAVRSQVARDAARQAEVDKNIELDALGQQYRIDNQQELVNFDQRKGKVLLRSIQDRTEAAKTMLSRSGDRGQKVVDAMDTAYVNNLLSPEDDRKNLMVVGDRLYNVKTKQFVNDGKPQVFKEGDYVAGAGGLVRVGGGAGSKIKETKDTPAGILAIYEDGSTKILNSTSNASAEKQKTEEEKKVYAEKKQKVAREIYDRIESFLSTGAVEQAGASVWNAAGNYANKTFGFQSDTASARSTIDTEIKGKLTEFILKRFQDEGVSANKLGDTRKELELHVASLGNFDYERLPPDELKASLRKIAQEMMHVASEHPYYAAGAYELPGQKRGASPVNTPTPRSPSGLVW